MFEVNGNVSLLYNARDDVSVKLATAVYMIQKNMTKIVHVNILQESLIPTVEALFRSGWPLANDRRYCHKIHRMRYKK